MLVTYTLWTLTVYLTDVWKLSFTHAATILNVYYGSIGILPLIISFLVDTLVGNSRMLLCSSLALCTGMGFLSMSTPPVLSKSTGTCGSYEPECVGDTQRVLFYTGLTLTALGMAGHVVSIDGFLRDQPADDGEYLTTRYSLIAHAGYVGVLELFIYEFLGFPYFIKPWSLHFGFPAICILVATTSYLCAYSSYTYVKPQGSNFTTVVRVFVASASKLYHRQPADPSALHEMASLSIHHTRGLRFLNKAAIVIPNQSVEEQQKNKWKLCTATEVESTKLRAKRLNRKWTAKVTFPTLPLALTILLWVYAGAKLCFPLAYFKASKKIWSTNAKTIAPAVGLMVSMLLGLLCCVTAAGVESHRLGVVKSHGLVNKPDESIPMSVYWLVPQFLFLGCAAGMLESSVAKFSDKYSTPSLSNYLHAVCCAAHSVGCVGSIAVVHVLGKVKPSWFQDTINQSRLDSYYWFLSCLCAINIVWYYVVLRCFYAWRNTGENGSRESRCSCSFYSCFQRCCCFC